MLSGVTEQALRATAFNGRLLVIGFANGSIKEKPAAVVEALTLYVVNE